MKKYYITTPLYYVNSRPHIGHAYTTMAADILTRYLRSKGEEVYFQTGTDEHGTNIEKTARKQNIPPKQWCDEVSADFRGLWNTLNIKYDYFIRTTDEDHQKRVQAVFEKLIKSGDIYLGSYEGLYCDSCENFFDESELKDGCCPIHGRPVSKVKEESYFFRLSKYEQPLLRYYEEHPDFLAPSYRARELVNFVKQGLKDLSVSRTKVSWGIPILSNPHHTIYVWFDALLNYITGLGYDAEGGSADKFREIWPADVQLVGKEIFRFHGVIWPAMLMALGVELPKKVYAHGWWTMNGEKMSKSKGNFIKAEDIVAQYGLDPLRYFSFREITFGQDGDFSMEAFRRRYNADLANDLGNLFSRVISIARKNLNGRAAEKAEGEELKKLTDLAPKIDKAMRTLQFSEALDYIWQGISGLNKFTDAKKPWELAKKDKAALKVFMDEILACLDIIAGWINPFMPGTAEKMKNILLLEPNDGGKIPPLFPRLQQEEQK